MLIISLLDRLTALTAATHVPLLAYVIVISGIAVVAGRLLGRKRSTPPIYNPPKWWELTNMRCGREFGLHGPDWIRAWFSKNNTPIRFVVDSGYCTILPSSMGDELRKMKQLSLYQFLKSVSESWILLYIVGDIDVEFLKKIRIFIFICMVLMVSKKLLETRMLSIR